MSDALVKASAPPYLLVLDLFGRVDEAAAAVRLGPDEVVFTLPKARARRRSRVARTPPPVPCP